MKANSTVTYEVLGYESQAAFDGVRFEILDDAIPTWKEAFQIGRTGLSEYPIVKVQSSDREEIKVLHREIPAQFSTSPLPASMPSHSHAATGAIAPREIQWWSR